jgi:hypothetical protein
VQTKIALIQEPWKRKNKVQGLNRENLYVHEDGVNPPRACVLTSAHVKVWPMLEFCNADCMAVSTEWPSGTVVFASVYLPYDGDDPPPTKVRQLVTHCNNNGLPLIIGCDANAHHILWGSSNVNVRGEQLIEYIMGTQLNVVNTGHKPTFVVANRSERIDITLVSDDMLNKVGKWNVSDEESFSDHKIIRFEVGL